MRLQDDVRLVGWHGENQEERRRFDPCCDFQPLVHFFNHPVINTSHTYSLIMSGRHYPGLSIEISAGLIYPTAQLHSDTISLSSSCCLFKTRFYLFSSFLLLFLCDLPPPHHRLFLTDSPASVFHQPISLSRITTRHQHQSLDSTGRYQSRITCCNQHFLYFIHLTCVFLCKVINEATCPQKT